MLKCMVLVALTCCMQSGETAIGNNKPVQSLPSEKQDQNGKRSVDMDNSSTRSFRTMPNCCRNMSYIRNDYVYTPEIGAHKLHALGSNWNTARKTCIREGGHLAIINSEAEHDKLLQWIRSLLLIGAWVGFHDFYEKGDWTTVLDQSLKSTGFAKWSPKWLDGPHSTDEKCGLIVHEGGFDHGPCTLGLPFICEIPICTAEISGANSKVSEHLFLS